MSTTIIGQLGYQGGAGETPGGGVSFSEVDCQHEIQSERLHHKMCDPLLLYVAPVWVYCNCKQGRIIASFQYRMEAMEAVAAAASRIWPPPSLVRRPCWALPCQCLQVQTSVSVSEQLVNIRL